MSQQKEKNESEFEKVSQIRNEFPLSPVLTPAQVAAALQIPVKSVHALCRAGKLGYYWINGKERRFELSDIEAYKAACRVEAKTGKVPVSESCQPAGVPCPPSSKSPVDTSRPDSLPSQIKGGDEKKSRKKLSGESVRARLKKEMAQW